MEKPSYYAILTADVRYDKNLSANEKLLFAEITSLTHTTGWCWASNNYFANLFNVTPQAISKWVNKLKKLGYIEVEMKYDKNNPKVISCRYIKPLGNNSLGVSTEDLGVSTQLEGGINHCLGGYQQRIKDINTSINNTSINNKEYIGEFPVESHCEESIPYQEIIDYLNQKTGKHYRANIKKTKECINARWKEGFRLDDFRQVIDNKCSQWLNNKDMNKYLRPQTLFGTKFESYLNEDEQSQDDDIWAKMMRGEI